MVECPQVQGPLAGVKVVDVTHMLSGPYCTWLLGSLGADVVKVERPAQGDFTRRIAPFHDGESLYFASVNRNKRSLALDLKSDEGKDILRRLAESADILVENNRPGVMDRLGLSYPALSSVNERLIYASISGFGQTGPYRHRPAFDAVIQAMSGLMSITGETDRGPVRVGASVGDITASLFAAVGILAALQERARTGRGTFVDVAMLDAQVAVLENAFSRYLNTGEIPGRIGTRHPLVTPFQAFMAADGPLVVCCDTEQQWHALCATIDRPDLPQDPRFSDGNSRTQNHASLEPILAEIFLRRPRTEWLTLLEAADVPAGPVNTIAEVAADPQIAARDMIASVGSGRFAAMPVRMPSNARQAGLRAPTLGEHTAAILSEIGFSTDEIARLRRTKVV
jgi:crotonobetainyl-CoA:carnitine CoA-transferase CaiB-like acyl-CoA transferase